MTVIANALRTFGRFWWEFLVGDTPELFVAAMVIVGVAFALRPFHVAAIVTLPVLAIVALTASAFRGRRRAATSEPGTVDPRDPSTPDGPAPAEPPTIHHPAA